jgi:hypothetical protein
VPLAFSVIVSDITSSCQSIQCHHPWAQPSISHVHFCLFVDTVATWWYINICIPESKGNVHVLD